MVNGSSLFAFQPPKTAEQCVEDSEKDAFGMLQKPVDPENGSESAGKPQDSTEPKDSTKPTKSKDSTKSAENEVSGKPTETIDTEVSGGKSTWESTDNVVSNRPTHA